MNPYSSFPSLSYNIIKLSFLVIFPLVGTLGESFFSGLGLGATVKLSTRDLYSL